MLSWHTTRSIILRRHLSTPPCEMLRAQACVSSRRSPTLHPYLPEAVLVPAEAFARTPSAARATSPSPPLPTLEALLTYSSWGESVPEYTGAFGLTTVPESGSGALFVKYALPVALEAGDTIGRPVIHSRRSNRGAPVAVPVSRGQAMVGPTLSAKPHPRHTLPSLCSPRFTTLRLSSIRSGNSPASTVRYRGSAHASSRTKSPPQPPAPVAQRMRFPCARELRLSHCARFQTCAGIDAGRSRLPALRPLGARTRGPARRADTHGNA